MQICVTLSSQRHDIAFIEFWDNEKRHLHIVRCMYHHFNIKFPSILLTAELRVIDIYHFEVKKGDSRNEFPLDDMLASRSSFGMTESEISTSYC